MSQPRPFHLWQLSLLQKYTGVDARETEALIRMIRTNACQVTRYGAKAGCALSALMGYHNHDCKPNAQAQVTDDGAVTITALSEIASGDEVTISYVDTSNGYAARRQVLQEHYGFDCNCARCQDDAKNEHRRALKAKMQSRAR